MIREFERMRKVSLMASSKVIIIIVNIIMIIGKTAVFEP
jgi:hypothetical protein